MSIVYPGVEGGCKFSDLVFLKSFHVITVEEIAPVPVAVTVNDVVPQRGPAASNDIETECEMTS